MLREDWVLDALIFIVQVSLAGAILAFIVWIFTITALAIRFWQRSYRRLYPSHNCRNCYCGLCMHHIHDHATRLNVIEERARGREIKEGCYGHDLWGDKCDCPRWTHQEDPI